MNCQNVFNVLGDTPHHARLIKSDPTYTGQFVLGLVASAFRLPVSELQAHTRRRARIAFARQVAMYIAHVGLGLTLTEVGRIFRRDRTTAAHACRVIEDRRDDPAIDQVLTHLEATVQTWHSAYLGLSESKVYEN